MLFFLYTGVTSAVFSLSGKVDVENDLFTIDVIGLRIDCFPSLRSLAEIASFPVAFFTLSLSICFAVNDSWTGLKDSSDLQDILSVIACILGWAWSIGIESFPIFWATFTKKLLKILQTSCWSEMRVLSSQSMVSFFKLQPLFVRNGFTVGQKSFDLFYGLLKSVERGSMWES